MSFDNWKKRLEISTKFQTVKERAEAAAALKINFLQPNLDDEGYYRKPITEPELNAKGERNGKTRVIGFEPVAYFIKDGVLCGTIGKRRMTPEELRDEGMWSWVVNRPITYELWYQVAVEGMPWPDLEHIKNLLNASPAVPAANREVTASDNQPPEDDRPAHEIHAEAINNAVRAAKDLEVTDETSAGIVLGAKNRIAELRNAADKAGHAIYDPLHQAYKAEQKKWPPMIAVAETMEKALERRYLIWRAAEKKKADEAAAAAAAKAKEIEEANARAADRAIASGTMEPAPVVPEATQEAAPSPVSPTYRASGQRAKPKEVETWHLDGIEDYDAVYAFFKNDQNVTATLLKLATVATKNGTEVPGTKRHFGLI